MTSARFTVFPGVPAGYAGFTDHHAMRSELHGVLSALTVHAQCALVAFGAAFVGALLERRDVEPRTLHADGCDETTAQWIQALECLQHAGTDNAAPSTANLHGALLESCRHLREEGPIRGDYWASEKPRSAEASDDPDAAMRAQWLHSAETLGPAAAARMT